MALAQVDVGEIVSLTNKVRTENRLSILTSNPKLTEAAQKKADDIFKNDYWAHVSPAGVTPWYWIKNTGYKYSSAGENLANGFKNSSDVINAWMRSPTHKQNLMSKSFCQTGVAVANGQLKGKQTTVVVQMMACPKTTFNILKMLRLG